jgi:hypothetical protein
VGALANSFIDGRPPQRYLVQGLRPVPTRVRHDEEPLDELARLDVADTLTLTRSARNQDHPTGDLALLHRDYPAAAAAYLAEIADDPQTVFGWAGLAVARQFGPGGTSPVYRDTPELVAAVFRALGRRLGPAAPPPDAVARWLAP